MPKTLIMAAMTVATALPAVSQADHVYNSELLCAAESLHQSIIKFESIACTRPFPRHEQHYIRLMMEKSCRLVDGIKCGAPRGRVYGDFHVVKAFMFTVNHRLRHNCSVRHDHPLQHSWYHAQTDFGKVACLISPSYHHHHGCPCDRCAASPYLRTLPAHGSAIPHQDSPYRGHDRYPVPFQSHDIPPRNYEPPPEETLDLPPPHETGFRGPRHIETRRYPEPVRSARRERPDVSSILRILVSALEDR